jgi:hypothetical protein
VYRLDTTTFYCPPLWEFLSSIVHRGQKKTPKCDGVHCPLWLSSMDLLSAIARSRCVPTVQPVSYRSVRRQFCLRHIPPPRRRPVVCSVRRGQPCRFVPFGPAIASACGYQHLPGGHTLEILLTSLLLLALTKDTDRIGGIARSSIASSNDEDTVPPNTVEKVLARREPHGSQ